MMQINTSLQTLVLISLLLIFYIIEQHTKSDYVFTLSKMLTKEKNCMVFARKLSNFAKPQFYKPLKLLDISSQ